MVATILKFDEYNTKLCIKCAQSKPKENFTKNKNSVDGLYPYCRECHKEYRKQNYVRDKKTYIKYRESLPIKVRMLKWVKGNAKARGLEFNLTVDDLPPFPSYCPILGLELGFKHPNKKQSYSLDRIDNTKGYIKGNVVIISKAANSHKGDMSFEDIERMYLFYKQFQRRE